MNRVHFLQLKDDITKSTADYITGSYRDASRVAVVSGGRRPSLFIKKRMLETTRKPFLSPRFFSNDEFMDYIVSKELLFSKMNDLDACFAIYRIIKSLPEQIPIPGSSFPDFLPWAGEMLSVLERSDLERKTAAELKNIENLGKIGYHVPEGVNALLGAIAGIREKFHEYQLQNSSFCRGFVYLQASELIKKTSFPEFDAVIFAGLFHLHKTEIEIVKTLYENKNAVLLFQGDPEEWGGIKKTVAELNITPEPRLRSTVPSGLSLHASSDLHSEISSVREAVKAAGSHEDTVIVLPDPSSLIPLTYELAGSIEECNISIGYPVRRSILYSMLTGIIRAQATAKDGSYYSEDYLKVMGHPFIKNLHVNGLSGAAKKTIHKIEDALRGHENSVISGKSFIKTEEIESAEDILSSAAEELNEEGLPAGPDEIKSMLRSLHRVLFTGWSGVGDFNSLAETLEELIHTVISSIDLEKFPVEKGAAEAFLNLKDDLSRSAFSREPFRNEDIFKIFIESVQSLRISLPGTPLKGLQILGFLETRLLNFKNVIFMDLNEGVMPGVDVSEPLLPAEVMRILGIRDPAAEEETNKYHFRRLLSSAGKASLFYLKTGQKERSRFIEEIIWEEEKRQGRLNPFPEEASGFMIHAAAAAPRAKNKDDKTLEFLQSLTYSATSLNTYISCPLQFYYKYVQGLKETEDLLTEPEGVDVGIFVHDLLENTFKRFIGKKPVIDEEFKKYFHNYFSAFFKKYFANRLEDSSFLLERVLEHRLDVFLNSEKRRDVKKIIGLEKLFEGSARAAGSDIKLKARVDRTDEIENGHILIIDYKTGASDQLPVKSAVENPVMKTREEIKTNIRSIQLPLYACLAREMLPGLRINACLYNIRNSETKMLFKKDEDAKEKIEGFRETINNLLSEILDPSIPFNADPDSYGACRYCPYGGFCG